MRGLLMTAGDFARYSFAVVGRVFRRGYRFDSLAEQLHRIGVESLTVVNLCSFFIGLVLVLQTSSMLTRFGAEGEVSTIISASFVSEIGPVFASIMFAGRIGTGIAAEIGSMVVTEQIDAYRAFGADPLSRIGAPRVLATAVMLPALTAFACVVGIFSGFLVSVLQLGMPRDLFFYKVIDALEPIDIVSCVVKAGAFGLLIGLIATYTGFRTERATEAVGISTTKTMVRCVLGILAVDLVLTQIFLMIGGQ